MEIRTDARRGHIALVRDYGQAVFTFTDVGQALDLWQLGEGVSLTTQEARTLGAALIAWANHKVLTDSQRRRAARAVVTPPTLGDQIEMKRW